MYPKQEVYHAGTQTLSENDSTKRAHASRYVYPPPGGDCKKSIRSRHEKPKTTLSSTSSVYEHPQYIALGLVTFVKTTRGGGLGAAVGDMVVYCPTVQVKEKNRYNWRGGMHHTLGEIVPPPLENVPILPRHFRVESIVRNCVWAYIYSLEP